MTDDDIYRILHQPVTLQENPAKERMLNDLSALDLSEQCANDYISSLHNCLAKCGPQAASEAVLLVFRINPLVAVRAVETSSLAADQEMLYSTFKVLFYALRYDYDPQVSEETASEYRVILNLHKVRYLIMLIEASLQNSMGNFSNMMDVFLSYVLELERGLYQSGNKKWTKYLTNRNVQEIITHIPENRQIELIGWFWQKHLHAFRSYGKTDTFVGRKVAAMMEAMPEGTLWRHLENADKSKLSEREQAITDRERKEIADFIRSVVIDEQSHHIEYVERVLGKADFYQKLDTLLGPEFREEYKRRLSGHA